jgi:hypothetical protein
MAAVEMIYLLAAALWIAVVLAAAWIGYRFFTRYRGRRRQLDRMLDVVLMPVRLRTWRGPRSGFRWHVEQVLVGVLPGVVDAPRRRTGRGWREPHRWPRPW